MTNSILVEKLDSFFQLTENKTNIRTEIAAGITTFLTMAYILFVNPTMRSLVLVYPALRLPER